MTNQNSLCARVLKIFWQLGTRGIRHLHGVLFLAGKKALEVGLIKRIGDGRTTNIWNDRWIPGATGGKPICRREGGSTRQQLL